MAPLGERFAKVRVLERGDDPIGHLPHVPEVYLEHVARDFADASVATHDHRRPGANRLERRETEWLGHGRHHEHIGHREESLRLFGSDQSREDDARAYLEPGDMLHEARPHVAIAGEDEEHIGAP